MTISPESADVYGQGTWLRSGYKVLGHMRRGSLLDVYDCWSVDRRCRCVAKIVRPDRAGDARARRRLLREGRILQRLAHPHIVRAYDVISEPATLILETLTGATLGHLLAVTPRGLGWADVAVLGIQLCSAVQYLHSSGLLHLDLKPSNIVAEAGQAKLLDFDIARPPGPGRGEGTRQYMAPEQVRRGYLGPTTDVWSIGVVLFEASTRRLPFDFGSSSRYPQLDARPASIQRYKRSIPSAFVEAIEAALEPDTAARPSVDELARSLASTIRVAPPWESSSPESFQAEAQVLDPWESDHRSSSGKAAACPAPSE